LSLSIGSALAGDFSTAEAAFHEYQSAWAHRDIQQLLSAISFKQEAREILRKACALDVVDGRSTCVQWCPHYLLIPSSEIRSLRRLTDATHSGLAFYQAVPKLYSFVDTGTPPDEGAVHSARALLQSDEVTAAVSSHLT
jgi:hypothetical protein